MDKQMLGDTVLMGIANERSIHSFPLDEVSKWEPKNITKMGTFTYFKVEDIFYSIETAEFNKIFNK